MSDLETTNLKLPYLSAAQAQKHVTHNEALRMLDGIVQLAVLDSTHAAPPAGPVEGDRYIVAAGATGAWAGHEDEVAAFVDGAWEFYAPGEGWIAFDIDTEAVLVRHDGAWTGLGTFLGAIDKLGVNATADATNRLSVCSAAALFAAIAAADGGSGDIRVILNKEADADTATFLFQSGWSGRAEIGLAGDTDFVFKVSADGSTWTEAIRIDRTTGLATILYDNATSGLTATDVQAAIDEIAALGGGGGGAVASVFGRTGTVAAAASDYDASQVDNDSGVSGATVKDALNALKAFYDALVAGVSTSYDTLAELAAGLATKLTASSNLSDLASASTARTNLGLGDAATKNTGTAAGTLAAGDDSRITGAIQASLLTTRGDIVTRGASAPQRLAVGANDRLLKSDGTDPSWSQLTAGMVPNAILTYAMLASSAYIASGEFRAATASKLLTAAGVWSDADYAALTDAASITLDMSLMATLASVALAGNRTLSNPSNTKNGQFFAIKVTASSSTRTLSLGGNYVVAAGVEAFPISILTTETVYVIGFVESSSVVRITAVVRY